MTHDEAIERSRELHAGTIDEQARGELEAHLRECEGCRSLHETVGFLHRALPACDDDPDHPYADEIVASVLDPESLAPDDREWIVGHVAGCRTCADEAAKVEAVERRMAGESLSPGRPTGRARPVWQRPGLLWAVAASVTLALLLYPAYLGLVRLPGALADARGDNERLRASVEDLVASNESAARELDGLRHWTGAVDLDLVRSALRGSEGPVEIRVGAEQPFVVLGIEVRIPGGVSDGDPLRVRIAPASEPDLDALSIDIPVSQARARIRETGVLTVAVGSSALPPGRYDLDVSLPRSPDRPALLEVPVNVVR